MATKTLSVDEEAYRILSQAKRGPRDSFSKVIKRASWQQGGATCARLLERVSPSVSEEVLDRLEQIQREDHPPVDKWNA
jgi:predicted CopG family antitoxin